MKNLMLIFLLLVATLAHATVTATTARVTYTANGVTTVFAYPFYFQKSADLKVWTYNPATGAQVQLTLTTDYTVTGAGLAAGGSVTALVAPANALIVIIYNAPGLTQDLSMSDSGPFSAKQIELRLDKAILMGQRLDNQFARTLHLRDGDASGFDPTLPPTITANGVFTADPTGKFLIMGAQQASAAQTAQLIGGGDADPLHFHSSDRNRANHTGTQLAATISNFNAQVLTVATPAAIGAVTSARTLTAGTGLSGGGTLAADRTFTLADTTVTPAAYGSNILIPTFTVDQQGRLTAAGTVSPQLTTTQLSPTAGILGTQLAAGANVLYSQLETRTLTAGTGLTGGGTLGADRTFSVATQGGITPASYGLAGSVGQFTVNAQGVLTAAANVAISGLGDGALTNGANFLKKDGSVTMTASLPFGGFQATNFCLENITAGAIPAASVGNRGRVYFETGIGEFTYSNGVQNIRASENPNTAHVIPIAQNSPTINFVLTYNGSNSVWAAAGAGSTIGIQSSGSLVTGSPASVINANGGLQAGNVAGGVSAISVAAGGITPAMHAVGTANQILQTNNAASAVNWVTVSGAFTFLEGVATLASSLANAAGDWTFTPAGTNFVLGAAKMLKFTGQAAPAPSAGALTYDSGAGNLVQGSTTGNVTLSGVVSVLMADSTQSGQTSFADLGVTMATGASTLKSGNTFRNVQRGTYGTNSTDTVQLQLVYGATVLLQTAAFTPSTGATSRLFEIASDLTVRTLNGASSTMSGSCRITFQNGADPTCLVVRNTGVAQPVTFDATASATWKWQVKHGSANASNTETLQTGTWEKVN